MIDNKVIKKKYFSKNKTIEVFTKKKENFLKLKIHMFIETGVMQEILCQLFGKFYLTKYQMIMWFHLQNLEMY